VRRVTYTVEILKVFEKALLRAEKNIIGVAEAELKTGAHCKWCRAKGFCKAQKQMALSVAKTSDFKKLPLPATLTMEEIGEIIVKGDLVVAWVKAVGIHAHTLAENGEKIPFCKLVAKRQTRQWLSEEKAEEFLVKEIGKEEAFEHKMLSVAKAEKVLKKVKKKLDIELICKPDTGTKLVSMEHKGIEIDVTSVKTRFLEADERFN